MLRKITTSANIHGFLGSNELQGFLGDYSFMQPETIEELDTTFLKFLPQLLNVALREITDEQASKEPHLATSYPKNATACLTFFCRRLNGIVEAVPIVFATLARKGVLHPVIATNISDIITTARMAKEGAVADRVRIALNAEVMHGTIRQLACSTTIADMLLNLFDPIDASFMEDINEAGKIAARSLFTQHWIHHDFPMSLIRYVSIAMASEDCLPYFYFLGEMVMKAEKTVVGSLVDVLMSEEAVNLLFDAILEAAQTPNALETFPLIGDGIRLMHTFVSMGLALVEDTTTEDLTVDRAVASTNATLKKFEKIGPQLLQIVSGELDQQVAAGGNGTGTGRKRLGEMRYRTIRLLTTRIESRTLRSATFLSPLVKTLIKVGEEFPQSDLVLSVMDAVIGCLSQLTKEETIAILECTYISDPSSPARLDDVGGSNPSSSSSGASTKSTLIDTFAKWRSDPAFSNTCLHAHSAYYLRQFQTVLPPMLASEVSAQAGEILSSFLPELESFGTVITGEGFLSASPRSPKANGGIMGGGGGEAWDSSLLAVVHKEMLNPNGVDLTDLAERGDGTGSFISEDDKAARLINPPPAKVNARSSRYSSVDGDDDPVALDEEDNDDISGLVDGKNCWADDDDEEGDPEEKAAEAIKNAVAEAEDEWDIANSDYAESQASSSQNGEGPTMSTGSPQQEDQGKGRPMSADENPELGDSRGSMGSRGAPSSAGSQQMEGFGGSDHIVDEDEDVMMMTPPATPEASGSAGPLGEPVQWRPGSSGMDGLLPPNSAGSVGEGDLIPPPPNGVVPEDDEDEDAEDGGI